MFNITTREGKQGRLYVDPTAVVKDSVIIDLSANIHICADVEIQDGVRIFTHKHHWGHSRERRKNSEKKTFHDLFIGEDAFIGVNSILLGIKYIGRGAIIGAGSIITHDVPDYEIWAGNPAHQIGERNEVE